MSNIFRTEGARFSFASFFIALVSAVFISSCGVKDNSLVKSWSDKPLSSRISDAELKAVYTNATQTHQGRVWPQSKSSLRYQYTPQNAPKSFVAEFGQFTAGIESKGYINVGVNPPSAVLVKRLISNIESVSRWKTIVDSTGASVFSNAQTTDSNGRAKADVVDGVASASGERHYVKLMKKKFGLTITVPAVMDVYERNGTVQIDIVNYAAVSAPLAGTIIHPGNFKVKLKLFSHLNGWAVYGGAAAKLEKLENQLDPAELDRMLEALYWWVVNNTILPLN